MGANDELGVLYGYEVMQNDHIVVNIEGESCQVDILEVFDLGDVIKVRLFSHFDGEYYQNIDIDPDLAYEVWGY